MRVHVKVCGITDHRAAEAAVAAGADAIGFVFSDSVRQVTPEKAAAIASGLGAIATVAVFREASLQEMLQVLEAFPAHFIQANHRSLVGMDLPVATVPVFREGVDSPEAVAAGLTGHHRRFLYEGTESGIGRKVDWGRASRISTIGEMSLAGGLSPDNVVEAIRRVMPFGVDVSSGVEAAPGVKDPVLIRRFVESARSVDAERTRP